jgi:hypothetical protein
MIDARPAVNGAVEMGKARWREVSGKHREQDPNCHRRSNRREARPEVWMHTHTSPHFLTRVGDRNTIPALLLVRSLAAVLPRKTMPQSADRAQTQSLVLI